MLGDPERLGGLKNNWLPAGFQKSGAARADTPRLDQLQQRFDGLRGPPKGNTLRSVSFGIKAPVHSGEERPVVVVLQPSIGFVGVGCGLFPHSCLI